MKPGSLILLFVFFLLTIFAISPYPAVLSITLSFAL